MRKEVVVAIIAGLAIGAVIAYGIFRANTFLNGKNDISDTAEQPDDNSGPSDNQSNEYTLTLAKPISFTIETEEETTVSGIAREGSYILISGQNEDFLIKPKDNGEFDQIITLDGGLNEIIVNGYDEFSLKDTKTAFLVYSTEFDKFLGEEGGDQEEPSDDREESATDEADSVREKVIEKIQKVKSNPIFYIGTITDKTQDTLQIRNIDGEIQQISLDQNEIELVNIIDDPKEINYDDVAIGDYILALGFLGASDVLEGKRIVVTELPVEDEKRSVILGNIKEIDQRDVFLTLDENDGKEIKLIFPKRWKGPEISELKVSDYLICVGNSTSKGFEIRSIFILD